MNNSFPGRSGFYAVCGKRLFDLALAIPGLVFLAPIMAALYFLIRVGSGPPVMYRQVRPGSGGRPFVIFKFRTMTEEKDTDGALLPDEARLTRLGRFLRATSLDELPELFNVIRGEMSLVGPRPLLMEYLPLYSTFQSRRHEARPGITGWAQVNGRNALSWQQKFELDVWYVDHQSFWLDIMIIFITIWKSLIREGINPPGRTSTEKFTGNSDLKDGLVKS